MARIETNGLDALMFDLAELAAMPDSVGDAMLDAGAKVIVQGHMEELSSQGLIKTGKLRGSVQARNKRHTASERYVLVYPYGAHHAYNARSGSYTKMNWGRTGETRVKGGGMKTATNNDVGFVHEFGGHGNRPRQWMRIANEKNIDKAVDAEYRVYDDYLKSKGM